MSIDARISAIVHKDHVVILHLASYRASDGVMSIPGQKRLHIVDCYRVPKTGQKIWGNAAGVIVEAGHGGERIMYERHGRELHEVAPPEREQGGAL